MLLSKVTCLFQGQSLQTLSVLLKGTPVTVVPQGAQTGNLLIYSENPDPALRLTT